MIHLKRFNERPQRQTPEQWAALAESVIDSYAKKLEQAKRERDEARAALAISEQVKDSLGRDIASVFAGYEQATALLREVRDRLDDDPDDDAPDWMHQMVRGIDAALAEIGGGK